jgi:hypothetical protein
MTQQTLILRPQTLRYAVPAPEAEGLLRSKTRATYMRLYRARKGAATGPGGSAHWSQEAREKRVQTLQSKPTAPKFRPSRYVGLMNSSGRRDKYKDAERVGVTRKLLPCEIDEWYARLAEITKAKVKHSGPLLEKSR